MDSKQNIDEHEKYLGKDRPMQQVPKFSTKDTLQAQINAHESMARNLRTILNMLPTELTVEQDLAILSILRR